jgi:hypothetical protein
MDGVQVTELPLLITNNPDTWIGFLGLGVDASDHGDYPGFSLLENGMINDSLFPSSSYGYTAGAHYRTQSNQEAFN